MFHWDNYKSHHNIHKKTLTFWPLHANLIYLSKDSCMKTHLRKQFVRAQTNLKQLQWVVFFCQRLKIIEINGCLVVADGYTDDEMLFVWRNASEGGQLQIADDLRFPQFDLHRWIAKNCSHSYITGKRNKHSNCYVPLARFLVQGTSHVLRWSSS